MSRIKVTDIVSADQIASLRAAGYVIIDREPTRAMTKAFYAHRWPEEVAFSEGFHRMVAASIIHQNKGLMQ